mgnify:CR=1 FL=1
MSERTQKEKEEVKTKVTRESFKKSLLFVFEDILSRGRISDDGLKFIKFLDLKIKSISSIFKGFVRFANCVLIFSCFLVVKFFLLSIEE